MHDTAREIGKAFFDIYWNETFSTILDFGSYDVNGTLRPFIPTSARYTGVDQAIGPNVDVVVKAGERLPFDDHCFDLIVTSSVFEHDPCFWETFFELVRVLKPTGALYINAPSNGAFHQHPIDCWRFYPDAGIALEKWARKGGFEISLAESFIGAAGKDCWKDFVAVFVGKEFAGSTGLLKNLIRTTQAG